MWYGGGSVTTSYKRPVSKTRVDAMNLYIASNRRRGDHEALRDVVNMMEDNPFITVVLDDDCLPLMIRLNDEEAT